MIKRKDPFKTNKTLQHTEHFKVKFNQTDALGIVWHGNYIDYFEDGREAFGRHYGISYKDVQNNGFAIPIVKTVSEYNKPLRYAYDVYIVTTFIDSPAAKLLVEFEVFNDKDALVCYGKTTQVFTDFAGNLIITM